MDGLETLGVANHSFLRLLWSQPTTRRNLSPRRVGDLKDIVKPSCEGRPKPGGMQTEDSVPPLCVPHGVKGQVDSQAEDFYWILAQSASEPGDVVYSMNFSQRYPILRPPRQAVVPIHKSTIFKSGPDPRNI